MDDPNRAERDSIEAAIRSAFAGVQLGSGVSLQQARLINDYAELSEAEWAAVPRLEITDDWSRIPDDELICDALAHLDADGLRYYLPALMLWLLDHYNDRSDGRDPDADATVIGTMHSLAPDADFAGYLWGIYDMFTPEQRHGHGEVCRGAPAPGGPALRGCGPDRQGDGSLLVAVPARGMNTQPMDFDRQSTPASRATSRDCVQGDTIA